MIDALLMHGVLEAIIGGVAVVRHRTRPVQTNGLLQHLGDALASDHIQRGAVVADADVQPGRLPADAPVSSGVMCSASFSLARISS